MSLKRSSSSLSPPVTDIRKRYLFEPEALITTNKYYVPQHSIEDTNDVNSQGETSNAQSNIPMQINTHNEPKIKIPPIFLHEATNHTEITNDINTIASSEFTTTVTGNSLRINLTNVEDYRNLTKFYNENNLKFYTYHNPETKVLSVIMRDVPISLSNDEIRDELIAQKYPVLKVTRLYNKSRYPMPLCSIELESTESAKEIFKLTKLQHSIVKIESRRKNTEIPQCKRCQRHSHTKNYCQLEPRCVKCTGTHFSSECKKKPEDKPTCVNCGGEHPANYRGCSYLTNANQRRHHQTSPLATQQADNNQNTKFNQYIKENKTYSNALRSSKPSTHTDQTTENTDLITTIIKAVIDLLLPHIHKLKPLLSTYLPLLLQNGST